MFIGVGILSIIVYKWPISINKFFLFFYLIFLIHYYFYIHLYYSISLPNSIYVVIYCFAEKNF